MAIELTTSQKRKVPLWITIVSILIIGVVLIFVGTYFYFYFSNKKMSSKIGEINNSIIPLEEAINEKENLLALHQQRIIDFESLLSSHKNLENIFTFLEKYTIPSVWFSDFKMDEESISLKGNSPNFLTIEQQIDIFSKQEEAKKVNLSDISITDEGQIEFSMEIDFEPAIFNYNFYANN